MYLFLSSILKNKKSIDCFSAKPSCSILISATPTPSRKRPAAKPVVEEKHEEEEEDEAEEPEPAPTPAKKAKTVPAKSPKTAKKVTISNIFRKIYKKNFYIELYVSY